MSCVQFKHVRRENPTVRTFDGEFTFLQNHKCVETLNIVMLHFYSSLGSSDNFIWLQGCAYAVVRFRHKNNLVRVWIRECHSLKFKATDQATGFHEHLFRLKTPIHVTSNTTGALGKVC